MISAQERRNHARIDRQHHCVLRVELSKKNEVLMRRGPTNFTTTLINFTTAQNMAQKFYDGQFALLNGARISSI